MKPLPPFTPAVQPQIGAVQSGIPVPPPGRRAPRSPELRNTMERLAIGESFSTTFERWDAWYVARALGIKIETRKAGGGCIRVWRIA